MMGNWKTCQLGDLITFQRGHDLPKTKMQGNIYPVVGSNGIIGYHDKFTTEAPSITIGRSGNVGKPFLYKGRSWSHNTSLYIREYKNVDPIFVYYLLQTLDLGNYAGGSAVPTLNRNHIHTLNVTVPVDIEEQQQIASVLSALDDKNEKNTAINENLFKQLFTLYEDTYSSLTYDEVELGSLCHFQEGYVNPAQTHPEYFDGNVKWLRAVDINESFIIETSRTLTQTGFKSAKKSALLFSPNTIAISKSGTIGRLGIVADYMCGNRAVINIEPNDPSLLPFIYAYLKSRQNEFPDLAVGSVQKNLYISLLEPLIVRIPSSDALSKFCDAGNAILRIIENNCLEATRLGQLRDVLLPRLMSGELDVSDLDL